MSGGEQQMVAIGRALMSNPTLLLLDEPSLGLAPKLVDDVFAILARISRNSRLSIVLVEQNASQALAMADRAYLLAGGRIVGEGPCGDAARRSDRREKLSRHVRRAGRPHERRRATQGFRMVPISDIVPSMTSPSRR